MAARSLQLEGRFLSLAVAIGTILVPGCGGGPERAAQPLIVLVTLDTLRQDAFESAMPATLAWAREGLIFDRHFAATTTTQPTHASIFTGLHPWEHGVTRNGLILAESHATLAERLGEAGYRCGAVVASFPLHSAFGWSQGFDVYVDAFDRAEGETWNGLAVPDGHFYSLARETTDRALEVLAGLGDGPRFLWVHYYDPHSPYGDAYEGSVLPLSEIYGRLEQSPGSAEAVLAEARERYLGDVAFLDGELARFLDAVHEKGGDEATHVVLAVDHGESFGEDGALGHGKGLGDEQIAVPLVVRSPDVTPGQSHVVNGSVDVFAAVLARAGLISETGGRDVTGVPNGGEARGMRRTFEEPFREVRTDGSVRFVQDNEFYRATTAGIARGNAETIRGARTIDGFDARQVFAEWEAALATAPTVELDDPEALRALEALGYVR